MKLDVHVMGRKVAQLYRDRDEYALKYEADAGPGDFVSLAMPVREEPWTWPRDLHPFFRQNLPEGYLLGVIREAFGPLLDGTDLSLLAVVGGMGIGRVTVTPEGQQPGTDLQPLHVEELLAGDNTAEHFADLVRQYARVAISGAVPKFVAPTADSDGSQAMGKSTFRTISHIIKGSDDSTPYLGFNEFYSLRVLERLQVVPVVKARMSQDGRILVVDRFDVDEEGRPIYGLEDACGLLGLPPHEKYATTTERVLHATRQYLPSGTTRAQMQQFGWHLLTNYVVRNADCHSKNVALYYTALGDVAYTPIYDVVTTQAYPRYARNPPGLSVEGRRTWAPGKALEKFFKGRLGIAQREYAFMVEKLCESAVEVGKEVIEAAKNEPQWHGIAKQMVHAWNEGINTLRSREDAEDAEELTGLEAAIASAGFSDPEPPEPPPPPVGRSDLLAPRGRR